MQMPRQVPRAFETLLQRSDPESILMGTPRSLLEIWRRFKGLAIEQARLIGANWLEGEVLAMFDAFAVYPVLLLNTAKDEKLVDYQIRLEEDFVWSIESLGCNQS